MKYRKDIDGLRAVAVLPVIFYHAGLDFFGGGFVGVDVFFVISGYLITTIIITETEAGTFTITNFYERRARRILPALFLVMLSCLPFAWHWMLPTQFKDFAQSIAAVSLFSSNILFWLESGYFEAAAELKPLLHTWSLAVEEQYYVLFPLFILLTWRFGKVLMVLMLSLIGLASIILAQWGVVDQPSATFYLMPTRLWELLLGSLAAFYLVYKTSTKSQRFLSAPYIKQGLSACGLFLIVYAIIAFDSQTPFPSVFTLIPTLGTALIILFASENTFVSRFLGNRLFVGIGLISYSAYLWHQPLFAFARIKSIGAPSSPLMLALGALSLVLAYLTWKYVEMPFRDKRKFGRKTIFQSAFAGSIAFFTFGAGGYFGNGFPEARLTESQIELLSYKHYDRGPLYREGSCFLKPKQDYRSFNESCVVQSEDGPSILIWGDSHAAALSSGIRALARNVVQFSASGCPPVAGMHIQDRPHCLEINRFVLTTVGRLKPEVILLHANWRRYEQIDFFKHFSYTIKEVRKLNEGARIYIVGSTPQWTRDLPDVLFRMGMKLNEVSNASTPMLSALYEIDAEYRSFAITNDVTFLSLLEELCDSNQCLAVLRHENNYEPTAWDYGHLTESGSIFVAERILRKLVSAHMK